MSRRGTVQRRGRQRPLEASEEDALAISINSAASRASDATGRDISDNGDGSKKDRRLRIRGRGLISSVLLVCGVTYTLLLLGGYSIALIPPSMRRRSGHFSRVVHYTVDKSGKKKGKRRRKVSVLDPNAPHFPSKREVDDPLDDPQLRDDEPTSKDYAHWLASPLETEDCKAEYDWMVGTYPSCNQLHEVDLSHLLRPGTNETRARIVANGYYRDVWVMNEKAEKAKDLYVVKSMRFVKQKWTDRNFDRHRRDALAMMRLARSRFVLDIYGFCGNSGMFEYAAGGDIADAIWPKDGYKKGHKNKDSASELTQLKKLHIATQATIGLAAVHNIDREGRATIAHADISPGQYVYVEEAGFFKLNDFNRARFLTWSEKENKSCGFEIPSNPGKNRAPEEYAYEVETEKIDVYSLGNIFYMLLQKEWPFGDESTKKAQKLVLKGQRPSLYEDVWNSTDPVDVVLKEAMFMAHEQDPTKRASARKIETLLKDKLRELDPGRLEEWGES